MTATSSGATLDGKRLLALAACLGLGTYFWDWRFLWPLKILVVLMHESGHAVASLLIGGSVQQLTVAPDQSGLCLSSTPDTFLAKVMVYSAGYVGSALIGSLLLLLTYRFGWRRIILGASAAWLLVLAVVFAGDWFTRLFCLGGAIALGLGSRFLPLAAIEGINLFLAAFSVLYVAHDLVDDLWNSAVRAQSDAQLLANVTLLPAVFWAALWTLASLSLMGLSVWWGLRRHRPAAPDRAVA